MKTPVYTFGSADPRMFRRNNQMPVCQCPLVPLVLLRPSIWTRIWKGFKSLFVRKPKVESLKNIPKGYNTISPVDIKAFFEYQDGGIEVISELQVFSVDADLTKIPYTAKGEFCFIIFDCSSLARIMKTKNVLLWACDKYGNSSISILKNVQAKNIRHGLSIDDLIGEEWISFTCKDYVPWEKLSEELTENTKYAVELKTRWFTQYRTVENLKVRDGEK